jgi:putative NADH-flavin reductase
VSGSARIPPDDAGAVQAFVGDARRVDDLVPAMNRRDAVIAILTPDTLRGSSTINSDATLALLGAVRRTGGARIVLASARPVVASRPALVVGLLWWWLRDAYRDLARAEGMLQGADVDWRVVRAVRLTDGPGQGRYHADGERDGTGGRASIDRADFARALLDAAEDPAWSRAAVGVGGAA